MLRRVAAPLVLCLLLAGCGGGGDESTESSKATPSTAPAPKLIRRNPANASTTLTIGSKNFTEEFILGEIYAQALKAGGYRSASSSTTAPSWSPTRASRTASSTPTRSTPARR